jgi:hypothetical protein
VGAPNIGVLSHPQPLIGHDEPVIFFDWSAALLSLLMALFCVISKFLSLRGHFYASLDRTH